MKIVNYIALFVFAIIANYSCKKNSDKETTTKVEYQVAPMSPYIAKITYTDEKGNEAVITDPSSQFANGSKEIIISKTPFTARIETFTVNTTNTSQQFSLRILANGQLRASTDITVPPLSGKTHFLDCVIQ